jgi:hypothetical protein
VLKADLMRDFAVYPVGALVAYLRHVKITEVDRFNLWHG